MKGSIWTIPKLSIADDSGVERELLSANGVPSGTSRLNRVRDKVLAVYLSPMMMAKNIGRALVITVPMALTMPFVILYLRPRGVSPVWVGIAYAFVIGIVMRFWLRSEYGKLNSRAGEIASAFLEEGICPCCAYNLAGVVRAVGTAGAVGAVGAEEKAARVHCPECGAGWNVARILNLGEDETHEAREKMSLGSMLRTQASLYNSMASKDDAGKAISLARYGDLKQVWRRSGGEHRANLAECISALRFWGLWKRLLVISLLVPLTISLVFEISKRPLAMIGAMQVFQVIGMTAWVLGAIAIVGSDIGRSGPKRVELLKRRGICPACGAMLAKGVEETACEECRAFWKLGDVQKE